MIVEFDFVKDGRTRSLSHYPFSVEYLIAPIVSEYKKYALILQLNLVEIGFNSVNTGDITKILVSAQGTDREDGKSFVADEV